MTRGAYLILLHVKRCVRIAIGKLGRFEFPAGHYVYVGSANRYLEQRIARHRRLADTKTGKTHWHIDYLLLHPEVRFVSAKPLKDGIECTVSQTIAAKRGTAVPAPGFGATDCRDGCRTHLYRTSSNNFHL